MTDATPLLPGAGSDKDEQPAGSTDGPTTEPSVPTVEPVEGDEPGTAGEPGTVKAEVAVGVDLVSDPDSTAPGWPVAFSFNRAKISGQGEDADPILDHLREDKGLMAVFDGMGGAGGTVYQTPDGPRTGAYLGSRAARTAVQNHMRSMVDLGADLDGPATAEHLRSCVEDALTARWAELKAPHSALRSTLIRALPTTMALATVQRSTSDEHTWTCQLWWAGDSRVYVLNPAHGAQQLTVDDIKDRGDALANLRDDSIVSNAMSADTPFVVRHRTVEITAPFLLIAATDGCFGYFRSPMHFEHSVLAALLSSADIDSWSATLQESIGMVTGDDASMAVLGAGTDHAGFRAAFADRLDALVSRWVEPLDRSASEIGLLETRLQASREQLAEQTTELWAQYKVDYQRQLGESAPVAEIS